MTFEQAIEQLSFHCGSNPNVDDPRWQEGFLQTLRPYRGLRKDVYENLLQCLTAVEVHLKNAPQLDRRIINSPGPSAIMPALGGSNLVGCFGGTASSTIKNKPSSPNGLMESQRGSLSGSTTWMHNSCSAKDVRPALCRPSSAIHYNNSIELARPHRSGLRAPNDLKMTQQA
jgi:hypothetical protein